MIYFNGTLQEFTYLHEQVTEISNPDESYLGTLNLFFKEPVTSNDEQTYFEESDAFEQYVKDYINNNIIQLQELNGNGHYIANDNGDTIQNISMTMTLQALLASNAYGTHLPMILKHALSKTLSKTSNQTTITKSQSQT